MGPNMGLYVFLPEGEFGPKKDHNVTAFKLFFSFRIEVALKRIHIWEQKWDNCQITRTWPTGGGGDPCSRAPLSQCTWSEGSQQSFQLLLLLPGGLFLSFWDDLTTLLNSWRGHNWDWVFPCNGSYQLHILWPVGTLFSWMVSRLVSFKSMPL